MSLPCALIYPCTRIPLSFNFIPLILSLSNLLSNPLWLVRHASSYLKCVLILLECQMSKISSNLTHFGSFIVLFQLIGRRPSRRLARNGAKIGRAKTGTSFNPIWRPSVCWSASLCSSMIMAHQAIQESVMNDLNDEDSEEKSSSTWILLQIADSGTEL